MKPVELVELVERAVRNSSKTRDLVLDPFGGSGSTLIACEKSERHVRLIELEPKYVDVIVKRWEAFTGRKAVRLADDTMFTEPSAVAGISSVIYIDFFFGEVGSSKSNPSSSKSISIKIFFSITGKSISESMTPSMYPRA